ncbi:MAG: PD-(D/E)XK nuclease family protein, partial [Urechidicola sp.]|nr:PD-(D/E)XK nuclease family protein [Urechidicola sp.]
IEKYFDKFPKRKIQHFRYLFKGESITVEKILSNFIKLSLELKAFVNGVEKEYVYRFYTIFQQLQTLNSKFGHIQTIKTLHQFFVQLTGNEKLSFKGEPLEGLQLMGMLETRVIDFETVIITSVNEGVLPSSKSEQSFIPFDVKQHYNIPTYREKDAIFSYHFYRLLHRAKNIYFTYNTESDAFGSGEKSRFLTQLEHKVKNSSHKIVSPVVSIIKEDLQEIKKTEKVVNSLTDLAKSGISPSALTTYINNPIDFYFQKILKLRDVEEVEETAAANTMGTVIHDTLEELYLPYINKVLDKDIIKKMRLLSGSLVEKYFSKEYKNGDISLGKNKLVFEVSKKLVDRFLAKELDEINKGKQIKIIALEQKLSSKIKIDAVDEPIKLHGIVDRVDEVDGVLRILDYKTGVVKSTQLRITDFSVMSDDYKYTKALQVMLYAYIYLKNNTINQPMEAGIISLRNLKDGVLKMNFAEKQGGKDFSITEDRIDDFLVEIKRLLTEIFNLEIPFLENPDKKF